MTDLTVLDLVKSDGTLRFYNDVNDVPLKLVVHVDDAIVDVSRALVPHVIHLNKQRYSPHISVIRNEPVIDCKRWGKREGESVEFFYSKWVYNDECYYWLRVYSKQLIEIRQELGLSHSSVNSRPPDQQECFHITIGNTKNT